MEKFQIIVVSITLVGIVILGFGIKSIDSKKVKADDPIGRP